MIRCGVVKGSLGGNAVINAGVVKRRRLFGFVRRGFAPTCSIKHLENNETYLDIVDLVESLEY